MSERRIGQRRQPGERRVAEQRSGVERRRIEFHEGTLDGPAAERTRVAVRRAGDQMLRRVAAARVGAGVGRFVRDLPGQQGQVYTAPRYTLPTGITFNRQTGDFDGTVMDTTFRMPTGRVWTVKASGGDYTGSQLQTAVNTASRGDVIVLDDDVTFTGNLVLPAKSGTDWIYIVSRGIYEGTFRCGPGVRVLPTDGDTMPKILASSSAGAIDTPSSSDCSYYRFAGIKFGYSGSGYNNVTLISLAGTTQQSTEAHLPQWIIFDRCFVDGTHTNYRRRGFSLDARYVAIIDSTVWNFFDANSDNQAIHMANWGGPYKIVNNCLEAVSENVFTGGTNPLQSAGLTLGVPRDIEIRRNEFFKRKSWNPDDPTYDGTYRVVKNLLELKSGKRVLIVGNVFRQTWDSPQQDNAITFKTEMQGPGAVGWVETGDVTFWGNKVYNVCVFGGCRGTAGIQYGAPLNYGPYRVQIAHNLVYDYGKPPYLDKFANTNYSDIASMGTNGPMGHSRAFEHNTFGPPPANPEASYTASYPGRNGVYLGQTAGYRLESGGYINNNLMPRGYGGVKRGNLEYQGEPSMVGWVADGLYELKGNVFYGTGQSFTPTNYDNSNLTDLSSPLAVADADAVKFVDPDNNNFALQPLSPAVGRAWNSLYQNAGADIDLVSRLTAGVELTTY